MKILDTSRGKVDMARIAGVDIPRDKRTEIALTYVFGVGRSTAQTITEATGVDPSTRVKDLTEEEVMRIRGLHRLEPADRG